MDNCIDKLILFKLGTYFQVNCKEKHTYRSASILTSTSNTIYIQFHITVSFFCYVLTTELFYFPTPSVTKYCFVVPQTIVLKLKL